MPWFSRRLLYVMALKEVAKCHGSHGGSICHGSRGGYYMLWFSRRSLNVFSALDELTIPPPFSDILQTHMVTPGPLELTRRTSTHLFSAGFMPVPE